MMKVIKKEDITLYIPETKEDISKLPEDSETLSSFASIDSEVRKEIRRKKIKEKLLRIKK